MAAATEQMIYQVQPQLASGRAMQFKSQFDGPRGARQVFMAARPADAVIRDVKLKPEQRSAILATKQVASLWLGLIAFEEQDYPVAIDYFAKRTLEAVPDGPWTASAQYNLGRAYEANGQLQQAIELYDDDDSPQRQGNVLRARRLKKELAESQAAAK